jgi:hypothetical protein
MKPLIYQYRLLPDFDGGMGRVDTDKKAGHINAISHSAIHSSMNKT